MSQKSDIYPKPDIKSTIKLIIANILSFTQCYLIFESVHYLAKLTFPNIYSFFLHSELVLSAMLGLLVTVGWVFRPKVRESYQIILKRKGNDLSSLLLFFFLTIVAYSLSGNNDLCDNVDSLSTFTRFKLCFWTSLIYNCIEYPWHRLQHLLIRNRLETMHLTHHIDKSSNLNLLSGISVTLLDSYPLIICTLIFYVMDNLVYFYIFNSIVFIMNLCSHSFMEGNFLAKHHFIHHEKMDCNYADNFFIIDYIYNTLRI